MWLLIAFIAIPLIEIALFIQVGGAIGLWPTLLIVVVTAILGTVLVKSQGLMVLSQVRSSLSEFHDPTEPLAHGAMILFSGALLLTPGFFTDAVGFSLLVPGIRSWLFKAIRARIKVQTFGVPPRDNQPYDDETIVEGEYRDLDQDTISNQRPRSGPSGWTEQ